MTTHATTKRGVYYAKRESRPLVNTRSSNFVNEIALMDLARQQVAEESREESSDTEEEEKEEPLLDSADPFGLLDEPKP